MAYMSSSIPKTSLITYNTKHSVNALSIVTVLYCSGDNNKKKPSTWSKQFNSFFLGVSRILGWSFASCVVKDDPEHLILLEPLPEGDYGYGPPCFMQYWGSNLGRQACSTDTPPTRCAFIPDVLNTNGFKMQFEFLKLWNTRKGNV